MKINKLNKINELNEMASALLNNGIDNKFYDYYMLNVVNWLLENEEKIRSDYENNKYKCKFYILVCQNLLDKSKVLNKVIAMGKEELQKYISSEFNIDEVYSKLSKTKDDYNKLLYFEKVRIR